MVHQAGDGKPHSAGDPPGRSACRGAVQRADLHRLTKREAKAYSKQVYGKGGTREWIQWFHNHGYGNVGATSSHLIPDYARVIDKGWKDVYEEVKARYGMLSERERKGPKGAQLRAMLTAVTTFSQADIKALAPMMKIGLLATINPEGLPHLTLISSLRANTADQMVFGQFVEGTSKQHVCQRRQVGFLIMTLDKELWRGKATFTYTADQGPEFEMYNNTDMFRYNAYFGIHTVYYFGLVEQNGRQALPMGQIIVTAIQTMAARALAGKRSDKTVLNPWTRGLMNKLDNLKFLAHVGSDGFPVVIPAIQAQALDGEHIISSVGTRREELEAIPEGAPMAVFGMSLAMEDVLLRGEYQGIRRRGGVRCGSVKVNWVYNPMPPKAQQIYPELDLEPVTAFWRPTSDRFCQSDQKESRPAPDAAWTGYTWASMPQLAK